MRRVRLDVVRSAFWLPSALAVPFAVALAFALTEIDSDTRFELGLFGISDDASARAVLQTIATATVSVAGLSFSVTLVALSLAAQQLSPNVLRTFRSDRIAQLTLAGFLGTFAYALVVLARLGEVSGPRVPELAVALGIVFALIAFGGFVVFIGDIIVSLQAATVIRRIAVDAHGAIAGRHPRGIGAEPQDSDATRREVTRRRSSPGRDLRTARAGFLTHVEADLVARTAEADALVVQRARVGDFLLTGELLAEVHGGDRDDGLLDDLREAFALSDERTVAADVAYAVRQLADVALRALSSGVNDPTTAENAMGSLSDTLIRIARDRPVGGVRVDADGMPRLLADPASFDELLRLGFEQVITASEGQPVFRRRLVVLLREAERAAAAAGMPCDVAARWRRGLSEEPAAGSR